MGYWHSVKRFSLMAIATATVICSQSLRVDARTPDTAPANLVNLMSAIDTAANNHQLEQLLSFYGADFQHTDGLTKTELKTLLQSLWEEYPRLTYDTELLSWEQDGDRLIAETKTTIYGVQNQTGLWSHLRSEIRAKQYFEGGKVIKQEILAESSELTTGDNPPAVRVLIPETVAPKENFGFDVIVNDPLNDDILLGGAIEEPIKTSTYTQPDSFDLDILPAGGVFKRVEAPETPGDMWYSAMIVRNDGITLVSHRVRVQEP